VPATPGRFDRVSVAKSCPPYEGAPVSEHGAKAKVLNSTVLEVASGLLFIFLAASLATGSIVEALASAMKWRSNTLLSGVKDLMNDDAFTGLAKDLYEHALINPRGSGEPAPTTKPPAYIDPKQFANALMDITGLISAGEIAGTPPTVAQLRAAVDAAVPATTNKQINNLLQGMILRGAGDLDHIRTELAVWFDNAMDRVSGHYKRITQLVNFVLALLLCVSLNIDTVRIATTLWGQPALVQAAHITGNPVGSADALHTIEATFPIGWPNGQWFTKWGPALGTQDAVPVRMGKADYRQAILGWLITALTTLFGAPFWFDVLQSVVRLKGSGPSPGEKQTQRAAAA
jgi:hypothetical protein